MEIKPFLGIGEIEFGKTRQKLRAILGSDFVSFKKSRFSVNETDAYKNLGIYLFYDEYDLLEFIELYPPFSVVFRGVNFFGLSGIELREKLEDEGISIISDSDDYDAPDYGFGIYIYEGNVRGVCIYRKGYYD